MLLFRRYLEDSFFFMRLQELEGDIRTIITGSSATIQIVKLVQRQKKEKSTTMARFELARTKYNGLAIHRLNHSATLSLFVK